MELIERRRDNELEVAVKGRLDTSTAPELEKYINENFLKVAVVICSNLIVDLSAVNYISSAGVRVIIATYKGSLARNLKFYIRNPSEFCKQVFDTIGIANYLTYIK